VVKVSLAIGDVLRRKGELERALKLQEEALSAYVKKLGDEHPDVGEAMGMIADTRVALGQYAKAAAGFRRALQIRDAKLGPEHPTVIPLLLGIARAELGRGRGRAAVAPLERAEALREKRGGLATDRADNDFLLARALWDVSRGVERPDLTAAFWAEIIHLCRGAQGRSRIYRKLRKSRADLLAGREAAAERSRQLDLRLCMPEEEGKFEFAILLTVHTMDYLHSGRHRLAI